MIYIINGTGVHWSFIDGDSTFSSQVGLSRIVCELVELSGLPVYLSIVKSTYPVIFTGYHLHAELITMELALSLACIHYEFEY